MDKNTTTGIILIVLLTFVWLWISQPEMPPEQISRPSEALQDSAAVAAPDSDRASQADLVAAPEIPAEPVLESPVPSQSRSGDIRSDSTIKQIHVENQFLNATITNAAGARLVEWKLKKYEFHSDGEDRGKVNLVLGNEILLTGQPRLDEVTNGLDVEIVDRNGKTVELAKHTLFTDLLDGTSFQLDADNPTREIEFYLPVENGRIVQKYIFYHDRYSVDLVIRFENLRDYIDNSWYSLKWENGLKATEENLVDDYSYAIAYAYQNGELEKLDVSDEPEEVFPPGSSTSWTGIRTKYFLAAIIPHQRENLTVSLFGEPGKIGEVTTKTYTTKLGVPFPPSRSGVSQDTFTVYMGPMDISMLSPYGVDLENLVMNKDWYEGIFRPISRWIVLPSFKFLRNFIPNYGLVIIIFSILIKLLLHPLTKKSYESMSQMQELQPLMTELKEKYKNDPQRMQRETMKLYKERGVNPLGGCLPMLLQMPLLFALFIVFRSTIQLRGEPFALWIHDLSRPDMLPLGFSLPVIGDHLSVLPFLMGLTMIWQSKMTMTDPKQKALVYFMPVFLIFVFYSLPSGLNLYYAVFNLLSMVQTKMIKKKSVAPASNGKPVKPAPAAAKSRKTEAPAKSKSRSRKKK